mgnify:FL=1
MLTNPKNKLGYTSLNSNFGFHISKVPLDILNLLKPEVNSLSKNFNSNIRVNDTLAGEIQNEFRFNLPDVCRNYIYQEFLNFEEKS